MILSIIILVSLIEIIAGRPGPPTGWSTRSPWPPKNGKPQIKPDPKQHSPCLCPNGVQKPGGCFEKMKNLKKTQTNKKHPLPKRGKGLFETHLYLLITTHCIKNAQPALHPRLAQQVHLLQLQLQTVKFKKNPCHQDGR